MVGSILMKYEFAERVFNNGMKMLEMLELATSVSEDT